MSDQVAISWTGVNGREEEYQEWNPLAQNLIVQTKYLTMKHTKDMYYVETPALQGAIERMDKFWVAVLVGLPGDGKTSLAIEVLRHYQHVCGITPLKIFSPSEWMMIFGTKRDCVVMIDDIFGSTYFEVSRFELWRPYFESILSSISRNERSKSKTRVIITSRKDILQESLRYIKSKSFSDETIFADKHIVDLCGDYKLSESLKREMLDRYSHVPSKGGADRQIKVKESVAKRIVETHTPLGFPYLCQLFFSKQDFFSQGESFFKQPIELLLRNLKHLYETGRTKYFTLVVVLLNSKDSCLDIRNLNLMSNRKRSSNTVGELAVLLGIEKDYTQEIIRCLKILVGVYLKLNRPLKVYEFAHSSIREAVFISFGRQHPDFLLKKCSLKDLELLAVHDIKKRKLCVGYDHLYTLCTRVVKDLRAFPDETVNLSIMKEKEFLKIFFSYLSKESQIQGILYTTYSVSESVMTALEHQAELNGHKPSLIYFSYRNPQFLAKLLESGLSSWHSRRWLKTEFSVTLKKAVRIGCTEVVEMLFRHGAADILSSDLAMENEITRSAMWFDMREQTLTMESEVLGSYELVNYLTHDPSPTVRRGISDPHINPEIKMYLANMETFRRMSHDQRKNVMLSACKNGNVDVVKFLLKNNTILPEDALEMTMIADDTRNELLKYLLTVGVWSEGIKTEALDCSCRLGKLQKARCLIEEGASFSEKALFFTAGSVEDTYDLIKYVHRARDWSETQVEDSTSIACMKGNVEIIRYFVDARANFSNKCVIFATLSPKPVPVLSVLSILDVSWSGETVSDAIEIACAKLDIELVECIINCKNQLSDRALAIAAKSPKDGGLELLSYLLENYTWSKRQKSLALGVASEHLNISAAEFLINHGARFIEMHGNSGVFDFQEASELLQQMNEFLSKRSAMQLK